MPTESAIVDYTMAGIAAKPMGNDHRFARPYGQYACKDGHALFGSNHHKL